MMYKLKVTWQEFSLIMQAVGFFFCCFEQEDGVVPNTAERQNMSLFFTEC